MKQTPIAVGIPEAAELVGISARQMTYYVRAGRVESRKIGRRRVVTIDALRAFLDRDQPSPGVAGQIGKS